MGAAQIDLRHDDGGKDQRRADSKDIVCQPDRSRIGEVNIET